MSRDIFERAAEALNLHTSIGDRIVLDEGALSGDKWHPTEARLVLRALEAEGWTVTPPDEPEPEYHVELAGHAWYGMLGDKVLVTFNHVIGEPDLAREWADEWLAARRGDEPTVVSDEPKRCSHFPPDGYRCRMNEGHATDVMEHYHVGDSLGYCDYDGCVDISDHLDDHLLADGTEAPA